MPQAREVKTWTNVSKFERIDQDQSLACWHHQQETTTALTLMLPQSHNMQREKKESIIDTNLIADMIWFVKIPCSSRVKGCGRLKVRGIRGWSRKRRGEKETNGKKILGDKYKAGTDLERDKIKRAWTWLGQSRQIPTQKCLSGPLPAGFPRLMTHAPCFFPSSLRLYPSLPKKSHKLLLEIYK